MSDDNKGELARYEAAERRRDAHWRAVFDLAVLAERVGVEIGIGVLRTAILINAGALVALLAFVAQIWNKPGGHQPSSDALLAGRPFVVGVISGAFAFGIAYAYQSAMTRKMWRNLEEISTEAETLKPITWVIRMAAVTSILLVGLTVLSLFAFVWGAWGISGALRSLT